MTINRRITRRVTSALAGAALLAALVGCSSGAAGDAPIETGTAPPSAEPATPPATTPATTETAPAPDPTETCSGLTGEEALAQWVDEVPPPFESGGPDYGWAPEYADPSTYDPCLPLSWIVLPIEQGTASSPFHVMLFNQGEYLGVATAKAYGFQPAVERIDDATISITYTYPLEGEPNAGASGRATATFTWNEETQQVDMTGDVPPY